MILKSRVLRRVQNLQQRGRRVAMKTGAELVDFVQHKHRVLGAGFSNSLDNVAGQSADIGAPVTADIRLIVYPAETLPHELPFHGPSDALPEGRLAHTRRTDKAQDRTLALRHQFTNR